MQSKKREKARFEPEKLQKKTEKARRRKGGEQKKKTMVALLIFVIATLEKVFDRKKLLDTKGLFGDNVIKNPARYIHY